MASFRQTREALLLAYYDNIIDAEEFALLYDVNTSKNYDYPYWSYPKFDLENLTDEECISEMRFYKADVYRLAEVFRIPEEVTCYNRSVFNGIEALSVFLKCFAHLCRYSDLVQRFGRPVPEICMMSNTVMNLVYNNFGHLLRNLNQPWLSMQNLEAYADAIHEKGAALQNCWGFVDGTVRPICRPNSRIQRILYNGHKRVHSIKFQSVVAPTGLIANLYGPVEGRIHDSGMLADSNLLPLLQQHCNRQNGTPLCIYGDPAYPLRAHLQAPFKGNRITPLQDEFNKAMSKVRVSVEWIFKEIIRYFAFLDFKKNLKLQLSAVGKMYLVCGLLANAHVCLYRSQTSEFFDVEPPTVEEYFI